MKVLFLTAIVSIFTAGAFAQVSLPPVSQKAEVTQYVGDTKISIVYHRPNVKGRKIWDGLQKYGEVWRAGANAATLFETTEDLTINGKPLPKGSYSLHVIPTAAEWTLIINKDAGQWGSFSYKEADDALRVSIKPEKADFRESLSYSFEDITPTTAKAYLRWENIALPFTIDIGDLHGRLLGKLRESIKTRKADDERPLLQAAGYVANFGLKDNYDEALGWLETSIKKKETYNNLSIKARILADSGKRSEAITIGEKAIALGRAASLNPNMIANFERSVSEWKSAN